MLDRIYCKNFRRIGECDIPIREGITTIIGKNGSGKSSVIESIIFNLFGEHFKERGKKEGVRRSNAPEDDLTYTVVDFTVQGVHYRCRRWYTKKMSANACLFSYTDEEYETLSKQPILEHDPDFGTEVANGVKGVTAAVVALLKVDYSGFAASYMAKQKELDSFKTLTKENRKQFFLDILGYSRLDNMKSEISSLVNRTKADLSAFDNQQQTIPQIQKEIAECEKEISTHNQRIAKGESCVKDAEEKRTKAENAYNECSVIAEKVNNAQKAFDAATAEKTTLLADISALNARIEENKKKSVGYDANSSIGERLSQANERMSKSRELDETQRRKQEAEGSVADNQRKFDENQKKIAELETLTKTVPSTDAIQKTISDLKSSKSVSEHNAKTAELGRKKVQGLIESVNAGEMASCPTCGTEISSESGKEHLAKEAEGYQQEIDEARKQCEELDVKLAEAGRSLDAENQRLSTYNMNVREKDRLSTLNVGLQKDIDAGRKTIEEFVAKEKELAPFKMNRQEQLLLNDQIVELKKQREHEDEMRKAYNQIAPDAATLSSKQERLRAVEESIQENEAFLKANRRQANKLDDLATKRIAAINTCEKYQQHLLTLVGERSTMETKLNTAQGNLKVAQERLEKIEKLQILQADQIGAQQVIGELRATLPGRIAPRLSETASHFLDIATNGRYTMIEISDDYEVYVYADDSIRTMGAMSGGEADIVALCVRIAIAKMLLEASGMLAQTFILDEIFGALDDERRKSTCEALRNIQNEMQKIICITHIDEIKDMADWTFILEMDENNVSYSREVAHDNTMKSVLVEAALAAEQKDDDGEDTEEVIVGAVVEEAVEEGAEGDA